jgi:hypothetical protein
VSLRVIDIAEPVVADHEVTFTWTVTPRHGLYERESFVLRFPEDVDVSGVAPGLWLRLALMVLHIHWPLLRPCRVRVPATLEPGEAELWLRLSDAAQVTLEAQSGGGDFARTVELVTRGPRLAPRADRAPGGGIVTCFSGGRDGLAQAAMLDELGERPTLVTVTSRCAWDREHENRRRSRHAAGAPSAAGSRSASQRPGSPLRSPGSTSSNCCSRSRTGGPESATSPARTQTTICCRCRGPDARRRCRSCAA